MAEVSIRYTERLADAGIEPSVGSVGDSYYTETAILVTVPAVLVDRTSEPMTHPGDLDDDLIEVPLISGTGQPPPDLIGEVLTELESHYRMASWLIMIPRVTSISPIMRKLSGKRK